MPFDVYPLKELPIVLNIPHASTHIPDDLKGDYLIDDLKSEGKKMADLYTDELFEPLLKSCGGIVSRISRLCVDMERFDDVEQEPMEKYGMGAVYTMSSDQRPLRKVRDRQVLIDKYYKTYHQAFEDLVTASLERFDRCLIIDCHSFNDQPRWYENSLKARPEICIGTDHFHTPEAMAERFQKVFTDLGYEVLRNTPFSGSIVPLKYYQIDKRVSSVMIEVNRKLYMDEMNNKKTSGFANIKQYLDSSGAIAKYLSQVL